MSRDGGRWGAAIATRAAPRHTEPRAGVFPRRRLPWKQADSFHIDSPNHTARVTSITAAVTGEVKKKAAILSLTRTAKQQGPACVETLQRLTPGSNGPSQPAASPTPSVPISRNVSGSRAAFGVRRGRRFGGIRTSVSEGDGWRRTPNASATHPPGGPVKRPKSSRILEGVEGAESGGALGVSRHGSGPLSGFLLSKAKMSRPGAARVVRPMNNFASRCPATPSTLLHWRNC